MATEVQQKLRKYVSEFTVSLGPIMSVGSLVPVKKTGSSTNGKFKTICPDCHDVGHQQYTCEQNHGPYTYADMAKGAVLDDGSIVPVSDDEVKEAKQSDLPANVLKVTVHPIADVHNSTWNSDSAYVFQPKIQDEFYALLVQLVARSGVAMIGLCNLRGNEGLFRLDVWRGHLIVQKIHWPEEVNEVPGYAADCDEDTLNAFVGVLQAKTADFDPDDYRNQRAARLDDLRAELAASNGGGPAPAKTAKPAATADPKADLLAALAAWKESS